MSGDIDRLAEDYYEFRLRTAPTWAHMIGEYRYADRFEDVSLAGERAVADEARGLAARAAAVPADGLDDQQRITRAMVEWDATSRAGLLDSRTSEFAANPIFGPQVSLAVQVPKLAVPDNDVAEGMVAKFSSVTTYFHDLAERHREGVASGRTPAEVATWSGGPGAFRATGRHRPGSPVPRPARSSPSGGTP